MRATSSASIPISSRFGESAAFHPRAAPIVRYGSEESVFVVAERNGEAIYWEDIEEGFNISPVGPAGEILEHWCNQDELGWALNRWLRPEVKRHLLGPGELVSE